MSSKTIFDKAEQHKVSEFGRNSYRVQSAGSARAYLVDLSADAPSCNCRYAAFNRNEECSHVKAVYLTIAGLKDVTPKAKPVSDLAAANDLLFGFS